MQGRTRHKSWLWALLLTFLSLQACVEPFELKTGTGKRSLVVSGMVTDQNQPELNKVTLSWTEPFDGETKKVLNEPVLGAKVTLQDNRGNSMQLTEGARGVYTLWEDNFRVEQGRVYSLSIRLPDGREYASRPELLRPAVPIQGIGYEFKEFINIVRNSAGVLIERRSMGFEVKAQVQDPTERGNYYRWDTEGVFEYFSNVGDQPIPSQCWANVGSVNTKAVAADDRLVNGRLFEQPVAVVPADIPTKYRIKIRQYSLTAEAYEFWRLLNQQQSSVGSIFDPPPARINGNVFSITNPEEQVVGYFNVSSFTEQFLMINRSTYAPFPGLPYELPIGDCRYLGLYPNVTVERPIGF
ncbi:DUF4249 domain-containing protein [Pontibacter sp. JH31]|uniref:DUF4249 domain-containing protein n=1 Tax=Pontibacter aquaedesilientis TaxID=2766980 RepID=A0ABR7XKU4_9BACT|nr:DUF4249 domain-containing protein [Pontibacter aquaedesilientis]MBD1398900.1 DUF4249 domain-containing protein [Pontibacter aquaedesilientis]